jgi:hypothetical protein
MAAAAAIPNADVERSRIFRLTEPLMADLRSSKLAAKTVLDFQLNRYDSCCFTRWLRFGKKPKTIAPPRMDII